MPSFPVSQPSRPVPPTPNFSNCSQISISAAAQPSGVTNKSPDVSAAGTSHTENIALLAGVRSPRPGFPPRLRAAPCQPPLLCGTYSQSGGSRSDGPAPGRVPADTGAGSTGSTGTCRVRAVPWLRARRLHLAACAAPLGPRGCAGQDRAGPGRAEQGWDGPGPTPPQSPRLRALRSRLARIPRPTCRPPLRALLSARVRLPSVPASGSQLPRRRTGSAPRCLPPARPVPSRPTTPHPAPWPFTVPQARGSSARGLDAAGWARVPRA